MTDLTFNGGLYGMQIGNQQFTMRNLVFNGCVTAISHFWDWGWVYQGISINNCQRGIDISAGGSAAESVGSMIVLDSSFTNTPLGIVTAYTSTSLPATAGSLILENVQISNVAVMVQSVGKTVLAGSSGTSTITAWGQGHRYTQGSGPTQFQGAISPVSRPSILAPNGKYYTQSKPQYQTLPLSSFVSVRAGGATGNGATDDTAALQRIINSATAAGNVVFVDAGTYILTSTLTIPPGARIVGEAYSVFMASSPFFNNMRSPQPVVKVGNTGQSGRVEWSDMLVSTRGQQAGAILIEWNLAAPSGSPSGMWGTTSFPSSVLSSQFSSKICYEREMYILIYFWGNRCSC
jgi:glucan 1,3-beta-glucosidase